MDDCGVYTPICSPKTDVDMWSCVHIDSTCCLIHVVMHFKPHMFGKTMELSCRPLQAEK